MYKSVVGGAPSIYTKSPSTGCAYNLSLNSYHCCYCCCYYYCDYHCYYCCYYHYYYHYYYRCYEDKNAQKLLLLVSKHESQTAAIGNFRAHQSSTHHFPPPSPTPYSFPTLSPTPYSFPPPYSFLFLPTTLYHSHLRSTGHTEKDKFDHYYTTIA